MTTMIDERTAWELVRRLPRGSIEGPEPLRVHHDPDRKAWLQVHPTGRWDLSGTPTQAASGVIELFLPIQIQSDLVIAQVGQSLDGRIATSTGRSHYITGPEDIRRLHRLRALVDVVLVGAGTVLADDPSLTVREVDGENPIRAVLDPTERLANDHKVFCDGSARTVRVVARTPGETAPPNHRSGRPRTEDDGNRKVESLRLPVDAAGRFSPHAVLEALRARGWRRVLVEGGASTVSGFLRAGALDRLHVTVAPILIGSGPSALELDAIDGLDEALRPRARQFQLGNDVLFDLDLR